MLWSTGSGAGAHEHCRTTRLKKSLRAAVGVGLPWNSCRIVHKRLDSQDICSDTNITHNISLWRAALNFVRRVWYRHNMTWCPRSASVLSALLFLWDYLACSHRIWVGETCMIYRESWCHIWSTTKYGNRLVHGRPECDFLHLKRIPWDVLKTFNFENLGIFIQFWLWEDFWSVPGYDISTETLKLFPQPGTSTLEEVH